MSLRRSRWWSRREPVRLRRAARADLLRARRGAAAAAEFRARPRAGGGYDDSYGDAVEGLTRLIAVAGERADEPAADRPRRVVASDLHSNTSSCPREGFRAGSSVFLVGDIYSSGTRYEMGIVPGIARLGAPVVAVSGNHDSRPLMLAAARRAA